MQIVVSVLTFDILTKITGVLVSMSPGPGPALITTTSIPQQPQAQPKPLQQPQVYHFEALATQPPQNAPSNGRLLTIF